MKKILIYAMLEGVGGIEEYVLNLSRYNASGNKYGYIIIGDKTVYEKELMNLGVEYYFVPPKRKIINNIIALIKLFQSKREEYDYIYFNTSGIYYSLPYFIAKLYKYKIMVHSHLTEKNDWKKIIHLANRWLINNNIIRFACSTPAAEWMFGKKVKKARIIPNAIDIDRFKYNAELDIEFREKLALNQSFVIGNVGRLCEVKNQKFLIEIVERMVKNGSDVKLVLVGEGENREKLERECENRNIVNHVVFFGSTSYPEKIMNCFNCVVMPSIREGFPISLVEAQAAGLECIISDTITNEIDITGDVKFCDLSKGVEPWIDAINNVKKYRKDNTLVLRSKGYDVKLLEKFVDRCLDESKIYKGE